MKRSLPKKIILAVAACAVIFMARPMVRIISPTVLEVEAAQDDSLLMSAENYVVLGNVIGAVENGGQIYGNKNYSAYAPAYNGSSVEYTCTLGWCSCYGQNAHDLIALIYQADPAGFVQIDTKGIILEKLNHDWVAERWDPDEEEKQILINLISSPVGQAAQDTMFYQLATGCLYEANVLYGIRDPKALMMYCEIELLGGSKAAQRIFTRCAGDYSLMNILSSLYGDFDGDMNGNLVGSPKYWRRHMVCATYINQFAQ